MTMYNPAHPAEILKELHLDPLGLTVTEAAKRLGMSRKALSEFINMKSGVSISMAYKLAKACNTTPKFWINLQTNYDLWVNRDIDISNVRAFG